MTQERIEAAAKKFGELMGGGPTVDLDYHYSSQILAAADAALFSDEAIERAAEALYMTSSGSSEKHWDDIGRLRQEYFRSRVRTVVAALRGDA